MKAKRYKVSLISIALLCVLVTAVSATTITAEGGTIPTVGGTDEFSITADSLPDGLSGFAITISLDDPAKAEIVGVVIPEWAGNPPFAVVSSLPADSVNITIVDLYGNASQSLTSFELVALNVRGDNPGTTGLNITIDDIQDKDGFSIAASLQNGTIIIGGTPPTTVPTTEVTTIPTTEVTTVPTTEETTIPTTDITTIPTTEVTTVPTTEETTIPTTDVTTLPTTAPSKGTVSVQSTPDNANVYLDGVMAGITPVLIEEVEPGLHTVIIEKTGYNPWESNITVNAGATTIVSATLASTPPPETGSIHVQSNPDEANVYLDNVLAGITPSMIQGISPGIHTIRIEKTGYVPWESTTIPVVAGAITVVSVELESVPPTPDTGSIDVASNPPGANTYLDGVFKDVTPLLIVNVTPGQHTLKMNLTGYEPWEETVNVTAGETTFINETLSPVITPVPTTPSGFGILVISSNPTGARILIDGVIRGETNSIVNNVAAGTREVTLEKAGYKSKSFPVSLEAGKYIVLQPVKLEPDVLPTIVPTSVPTTPTTLPTLPPTTVPTPVITFPGPVTGSLFVYSMPFGCSVFVDDVFRGTSPNVIGSLNPGDHEVRSSLAGYQDDIRTVKITAGKVTTITVVLIPDIGSLLSIVQ